MILNSTNHPNRLDNAILRGDCIEVMKLLQEQSIDFILTDPPYLVNYRDRSGRGILNDVIPHGSSQHSPRHTASCATTVSWSRSIAGRRPTNSLVLGALPVSGLSVTWYSASNTAHNPDFSATNTNRRICSPRDVRNSPHIRFPMCSTCVIAETRCTPPKSQSRRYCR